MVRLFPLLAATTLLVSAAAHAAPAPTAAQGSPGKSASAATPVAGASTAVPACPGDRPVWVNPRSQAYHLQGDRMFGHTRRGKYECEAAAKADGDHLAKGK